MARDLTRTTPQDFIMMPLYCVVRQSPAIASRDLYLISVVSNRIQPQKARTDSGNYAIRQCHKTTGINGCPTQNSIRG
ncbi:MAG: hypothetical protein WCP06_13695 [Verrucomicrobiota bacterium]